MCFNFKFAFIKKFLIQSFSKIARNLMKIKINPWKNSISKENGGCKLYRIDIKCEWNQENSHNARILGHLINNHRICGQDIFFCFRQWHLFVLWDETTLATKQAWVCMRLEIDSFIGWALASTNSSLAAGSVQTLQSRLESEWMNVENGGETTI